MLPITLTPEAAKVALIGEDLDRRRPLLAGAGITPSELPPDADLSGFNVVFVVGLGPERSRTVAERARRAGALVNVEDIPELCDFHVPAIVRRGDLLFAVSTRGRVPGLARRVREWLEQHFGPEWEGRSAELGVLRQRWRGEGVPPGEVAARTRNIIEQKGWLG